MTANVKPNVQPNSAEYIVRVARPEDAAAIGRVARETWAATYDGIINPESQDRFVSEGYSISSLVASISREGDAVWFRVAETTGEKPEIFGFAEAYKRPAIAPDAELARIYLLPAWQNKGAGKALVEDLLVALRALRPGLRPPRLWLSVATANKQAIRFYEQRGFRFEKEYEATLPGQKLALQDYVLEI